MSPERTKEAQQVPRTRSAQNEATVTRASTESRDVNKAPVTPEHVAVMRPTEEGGAWEGSQSALLRALKVLLKVLFSLSMCVWVGENSCVCVWERGGKTQVCNVDDVCACVCVGGGGGGMIIVYMYAG